MCQKNLAILEYAKKYKLIIENKKENKHLLFETDFEIILLSLKREYLLEANCVLRFIPQSLASIVKVGKFLPEECFWPSHKEDDFFIGTVKDGNTDEVYFEEIETTGLSIIKHRERDDYSTSFFKTHHVNAYELKKAVNDLKKNLYSMRQSKCALGYLPKEFGIIDVSQKERTHNPATQHVSFWKISSKKNPQATFKNIAKHFQLL